MSRRYDFSRYEEELYRDSKGNTNVKFLAHLAEGQLSSSHGAASVCQFVHENILFSRTNESVF